MSGALTKNRGALREERGRSGAWARWERDPQNATTRADADPVYECRQRARDTPDERVGWRHSPPEWRLKEPAQACRRQRGWVTWSSTRPWTEHHDESAVPPRWRRHGRSDQVRPQQDSN